MSSNKLHPIYVALDSHQYNRAVKLASALPPSNLLGQALLAHALQRSGAVLKALIAIKQLLWFESVELEYEIERLSIQSSSGSDTTTSTKQQQHQPRSKKGGKSKKATKTAAAEELSTPQRDLVEHLTTPLTLPEGWDQPATKPDKQVITDETTLDTLAVTLQAVRLYTTTFLLYATSTPPTLQTLLKSYTTGLSILAYSSKYDNNTVIATTLANMQVTALKLAREDDTVLKLWAAQTALWQLQHGNADTNNEKTRQRLQMLPRLAESLADKYKDTSAEACLLYVATLEQQAKHEEIVNALQQDTETTTLTSQQRMELLASAFEKLKQWEPAKEVYQQLLEEHSDQWAYWKSLLKTAYRQGGMEEASTVVQAQLNKTFNENSKYPCRARNLILCELAAVRIHGVDEHASTDVCSEEDRKALLTAIIEYGDAFGSRASCAYSDLAPYIEVLVKASNDVKIMSESLLAWANGLRLENQNATDRSMLRNYIFAIQVTYKVLSMMDTDEANDTWLPDWAELVTEWRGSQKLGTAKEGEDVQKENQPDDELVLLAVQNILFRNDTDSTQLVIAASLLEEALQNSPYNAYLEISAIDVYARLNAVQRAWELFQGLSTKHIQLDSLSYLIFSKLVDGGLYNETIQVAKEILKFHGSSARDTGDYAGQAMEHGTLSKANEFLVFQHNRMNPSLSLLDAKGRIMDCAPVLFLQSKKQAIGMQYGIAGDETDLERATDMVREAHNPFGAPSIMTVASTAVARNSFSDNRDFSVLSYQILYKPTLATKAQLAKDSIRRGLLHGLLVRLTLCLDATKGPKKGKVVKTSELLQKRCASLLDAVDTTAQFVEKESHGMGYKECMVAMVVLCRVVAFVSAGMPLSEMDDTLASREQFATQQLESIVIPDNMTWSISDACRFLPDMLVPFTGMLRMTANLFALYGWGKRKCHTRASAGALAKLASSLKPLVNAMCAEMESLPDSDEDRASKADELRNAVTETQHLEDSSIQSVCQSVSTAQQLTRQRVTPFLDEILAELSSFKVEET